MKKIFVGIFVLIVVVTPIIFLTGCGARKADGFYVRSILFSFSEQQQNYIQETFPYTDNPPTQDFLRTLANELVPQRNNAQRRLLFGTGGIFNEIEAALLDLTGNNAINRFEEFLTKYNDDPGMSSNEQGYFIPLGNSVFVWQFEKLARSLFNNENPSASIGNAFLANEYYADGTLRTRGRLAYAVTDFGVHIAIITALSSR